MKGPSVLSEVRYLGVLFALIASPLLQSACSLMVDEPWIDGASSDAGSEEGLRGAAPDSEPFDTEDASEVLASSSNVLVEGDFEPIDVAASGEWVYWIARDKSLAARIFKIDRNGTLEPRLVVAPDANPSRLRSQESGLYWLSSTGVVSFLSGEQSGELGRTVGVSDCFAFDVAPEGWSMRCGASVILHSDTPVVVDDQPGTGDVIRLGRASFWPSETDGGSILEHLDGSSGTASFVDAVGQVRQVASFSGAVYWISLNGAAGTLSSRVASSPFAQTTELAKEVAEPGGLAIDDDFVYWTEVGLPGYPTGSVRYVGNCRDPLATPAQVGKGLALKSEELFPQRLAVDSNSVYWTAITMQGRGQIRWSPKPVGGCDAGE